MDAVLHNAGHISLEDGRKTQAFVASLQELPEQRLIMEEFMQNLSEPLSGVGLADQRREVPACTLMEDHLFGVCPGFNNARNLSHGREDMNITARSIYYHSIIKGRN